MGMSDRAGLALGDRLYARAILFDIPVGVFEAQKTLDCNPGSVNGTGIYNVNKLRSAFRRVLSIMLPPF